MNGDQHCAIQILVRDDPVRPESHLAVADWRDLVLRISELSFCLARQCSRDVSAIVTWGTKSSDWHSVIVDCAQISMVPVWHACAMHSQHC